MGHFGPSAMVFAGDGLGPAAEMGRQGLRDIGTPPAQPPGAPAGVEVLPEGKEVLVEELPVQADCLDGRAPVKRHCSTHGENLSGSIVLPLVRLAITTFPHPAAAGHELTGGVEGASVEPQHFAGHLSLIHISEPTRLLSI